MPLQLSQGAIVPDAVFDSGFNRQDNPLDPCPACGSSPHDAPEGTHDHHSARKHPGVSAGDPRHDFGHCFKCGYRPGTNNVVSQDQLRRQFSEFQNWVQNNQRAVMSGQPSVDAEAQTEDYKTEIAELKAQLEAKNGE